ncbi:PH domain-containing protein [Lentisphaerota bacterium WC36G]|nr:PH domain-containing protein [Lentisphaerae bacterium WC36]
MDFICNHCGAIYQGEKSLIGQIISCESCQSNFEGENPNLTECPDCFHVVSKRAKMCPNCGADFIGNITEKDNAALKNMDEGPEKEIMVCQPQAMNYFWNIVIGGLLTPVLIGIPVLVQALIEIKCTYYHITTKRIIIKKGLINKRQNEIWIKDMRGANMNQNFWQRIVKVGNISIGTAATSGSEISIVGIANPDEVVKEINDLRVN